MAIEVVILTPLLVAAIMVIAAGGRYVDARGQVNSSAYAAATAAESRSPTRTPSASVL